MKNKAQMTNCERNAKQIGQCHAKLKKYHLAIRITNLRSMCKLRVNNIIEKRQNLKDSIHNDYNCKNQSTQS